MRALTLLFTFLISFPLTLSAQAAGDVLQKVSEAMAAEQWEQAVSLFRQAIQLNVDKSEMFYWTSVDKNSNVSDKMAQELTLHYKNARNYDKAYLFCKELLQKFPNDVKWLLTCAETEVCRGKEEEALQTYQKVLSLDANNLDANIFVGNYYYLKAEQEKQQLMRVIRRSILPPVCSMLVNKDGLSQAYD